LAGVALVLTGCGAQPSGPGSVNVEPTPSEPASPLNLVPDDYEGRFRTFGTVLESPEHGPQLCHMLAESLPPQCGGPDVAGWDWDAVEAESASGTTWGSYILVGTFDGETFTLSEPAVVDDGSIERPAPEEPDFATPCPEPSGGWKPVDPERATDAAFNEATEKAQGTQGYAGAWMDQQFPDGESSEDNANDPQRIVLNVTTTGDIAAMEAEIREVWGGSLCVSEAPRSEEELLAVQASLSDVPGLLSSSPDIRTGQLVAEVLVATQERQRELDERFGAGTVRLLGALVPID
jgi:hypothetical protein